MGVLSFACVLFGLLSLGWWISHGNNSNAIAQTLERTELLSEQAAALPTEAQAPCKGFFKP